MQRNNPGMEQTVLSLRKRPRRPTRSPQILLPLTFQPLLPIATQPLSRRTLNQKPPGPRTISRQRGDGASLGNAASGRDTWGGD